LARAGEDLEAGGIVATDDVVEVHRDYVDALEPVTGDVDAHSFGASEEGWP